MHCIIDQSSLGLKVFLLSEVQLKTELYLYQRTNRKFLCWKSFFPQHPGPYNILNFRIVRINQSEGCDVGSPMLEILHVHKVKVL